MADNNFWTKLLGGAEIVLGGAFVYRGVAKVFNVPTGAPLLGETQGREKIVRSSRQLNSGSIEQTAGLLVKRIKEGSLDPEVRQDALKVLTKECGGEGKWCVKERDYLGEVRAIFDYVRKTVRYTRDHYDVDQFASARVTGKWKAGDCDDQTVRLGALLRAVGYPLKVRIIEETGVGTWSHVWLVVRLPPSKPTRDVGLDLTVQEPMGWQAPGTEESLRTGRPAGQVARVKDFDV